MEEDAGRARRTTALWIGPVAFGALGAYAWLHRNAGYTLPVPWPDEAVFLWPAIALARSGSLLAPEMNPDLHMMWMPVGYMVVTAPFFAALGFTLELARTLSALHMSTLLLALFALCSRLRAPVSSALLCACFALGAEFVAAGNIARMEGLVLALTGLGLLGLAGGRRTAGWAAIALTPLVHPNGFYLVLAASVFWLIAPAPLARLRETRRWEWALLAIVAAAWVAHAIYVSAHWREFELQMAAQFGRKLERPAFGGALGTADALLLSVAVVCAAIARRRSVSVVLFCCTGVACWGAYVVGLEMWYEVYRQLGMLLVSLAAIETVMLLVEPRVPARARVLLGPALAALPAALFWASGTLPFPPADPGQLSIAGMRPAGPEQRVRDYEYDRIAERLVESFAGCRERVRVRTYPPADALLLYERTGDRAVRFSTPPRLLTQLAGIDTRYRNRRWEAHLVHLTGRPIPFSGPALKMEMLVAGIRPGQTKDRVLTGPNASQWYLREFPGRIAQRCGKDTRKGPGKGAGKARGGRSKKAKARGESPGPRAAP